MPPPSGRLISDRAGIIRPGQVGNLDHILSFEDALLDVSRERSPSQPRKAIEDSFGFAAWRLQHTLSRLNPPDHAPTVATAPAVPSDASYTFDSAIRIP